MLRRFHFVHGANAPVFGATVLVWTSSGGAVPDSPPDQSRMLFQKRYFGEADLLRQWRLKFS